MPIGETNTFALPSSAKSIALARIDYTNSHKALLQNFYSDAKPTAINFTVEGDQITPLNGTIYRSSLAGRLYVRDSIFEKGNPLYSSSWTRNGIGSFLEESLASTDITTYEVGELFVTALSNARLYMKDSNSNTFVDIGLPLINSITGNKMVDSSITGDKIANATIANVDFAPSTIQGDKIAANTLSNVKVIFDTITNDRVANNNISASLKIQDETITTIKFQDSSVTNTKIANNTLDTDEFANNSITTAELADNAVTIGKIADILLVETITGHIDFPEVDSFNVDLDAKYPYDIVELTVRSQAGSGTCSITINGVAVTGIDGVVFNTTENTYTATALDIVSLGADVLFVIDTESSSDDLMFTIEALRTG